MKGFAEPDLKRILTLLLKKAWLILLIAALSGFLTYGVTRYFVVPLYTADIKMYVNNSTEINKAISSSDLTASQSLVDTYIAIIKSDVVLDEVAKLTGYPEGSGSIAQMISAGAINNTEVFVVSVTAPNPMTSEKIANSIAAVASSKISEIVSGSSVKIIDYAKTPSESSYPKYLINAAIGMLTGFILAVGALLLIEFLNTRIKAETDLEKIADIPVLGTVSQFSQVAKASTSYAFGCAATYDKKARIS